MKVQSNLNTYRIINIQFDFEERVDGLTYYTEKSISLHSEYDSIETADKITKLLKSLVRKNTSRLLITIEGQEAGEKPHGIKRYSFSDWHGDFRIEHRPFITDYSVQNEEAFDAMTKMVKAFGIDFLAQILAHIEFKK